jgi:hypothetical protein
MHLPHTFRNGRYLRSEDNILYIGDVMNAASFPTIFAIILISAGATQSAFAQQETPIPRSAVGDKGKYYLLEVTRNGDIVKALSRRDGVDSVGYTRTETNCKTMLMREMGYSELSPAKIKENPTKWFELVAGSSKSDLASFVCRR